MISKRVQNVCGVVGFLLIVVGAVLSVMGATRLDWVMMLVGVLLITYSIFTGDRAYLDDGRQ